MFESLGLENWTPLEAALVAGGAVGVLFGIFAQVSRFCLRRGLVGAGSERRQALGLWLTALLAAIIGTQALVVKGVLDFDGHRFLASSVAVPAVVLGGLMFGAGMVLARGCASRLTVLAGTGNLRAVVAVLVFAVVAHAAMKGALAPLRIWLSSTTVDFGPAASLAALPGGATVWTGLAAIALAVTILRAKPRARDLVFGAIIGALVPASWFITGVVLFDEFDPITFESLAFTSSSSEALFWTVAGTAIAPGFGVGLFGGVVLGSALSSRARGEFAWTGFTGEIPTSRYLTGASLMGVGGVVAGGCTVGAGLSGVSTLSVAAILTLASIVAGALATNALLTGRARSGHLVAAE